VEPFYEAFADAPSPEASRNIVGASIVGLRLDGPSHPFDPQAVRILFGDGLPKPDLLCARFLSRDGRYFARGQYKVAGVSGPAPLLDFNTRYRQQLGGYLTTDFATFAVAGKSCDDPKGSQLFVVDNGGPTDARQLVVQIRAGDARMHAQLGRDNVAVGPAVLCGRPANGPTVGYTVECSLPMPVPFHEGRYQLSIGETGSGVPSREWLEFEGGVISAVFQPTESALSRRWRLRHENGYHKSDGGSGRSNAFPWGRLV
jgi:hypothetical protein